MKTAVEWLVDALNKEMGLISFVPNADEEYKKELFNIIDQAKEMEKEQRQEDTNYGYSQGWDDGNQKKEPMRPELKQQDNDR